MLIDWFTVAAQVVNFLILVWLLRRYLYRPVLATIDAREKARVAQRDAIAADRKRVDGEHTEWLHDKQALEEQRTVLINAARTEAGAERERILQQAARDAEQLRRARLKELTEETQRYHDELQRLARQEIVATVRKVLADLASVSLEQSMVDVFLRRLDETALPSARQETEPESAPLPLRLRSGFTLTPAQREAVQAESRKQFNTRAPVEFETVADAGVGIELTIENQKIAWSVDQYMTAFESRLKAFTDRHAGAAAASA